MIRLQSSHESTIFQLKDVVGKYLFERKVRKERKGNAAVFESEAVLLNDFRRLQSGKQRHPNEIGLLFVGVFICQLRVPPPSPPPLPRKI